MNDNAPKKRGRKPKNREVSEDIIEESVLQKKKGRKPSGKLYDLSDISDEQKSGATSECIFVHLALTDKDVEKITGKKIVQPTKVKTINKQISFHETDMELENALDKTTKELSSLKQQYKELEEKFDRFKYLETVVSDNGIIDKEYHITKDVVINENGKWKKQTDIWCNWCCHPFTTIPVGLPESYCQVTKKFVVRDCFCSFNCAHAYNISLNDHKVWERYALLNRLKNIIFADTELENKQIISAPPKKILKVFGGNKTIDDMRGSKICIPKKYINLLPPSVPFFGIIEEIPIFFSTSKNISIYDKLRSRSINPSSLKNKAKSSEPFSAGNIKQLFN